MVTRVGLRGEDAATAAAAVSDADGTPITGSAARDADVVAALDESALLDLLPADGGALGVDAPVLPVGAGEEYGGVPAVDRDDALAALARGDYAVTDQPTLAVSTSSGVTRAFADVTFVTREPAKISEFTVRNEGSDVESVRADGVVIATPTGSRGYASNAGGPVLEPDVDAVSVVPIAPFQADRTNWVGTPPLSVAVVRGEADVELYVDGRERGQLDPHDPVELTWGEPLAVAIVPQSRRPPRSD